MTGYGYGECSSNNGVSVSVQISSFNRKQADIRFVLPKELVPHENSLRKTVKDQVSRGAVTVKVEITIDPTENNLFSVDLSLSKQVYHELKNLQDYLKLENRIGIQELLSLQNVDIIKREEVDIGRISKMTNSALESALEELLKMRSDEGKSIKTDLNNRHCLLEKYNSKILKLAPEVPKKYREKLESRIQENFDNPQIEEDRILKEIVLFADRCDISEEITRLSTHLNSMEKLFDEAVPVGRKLDFLIQELFREINTIGSKCNDIDISTLVIEFKTELERIREQIQNIE